MLRRSHVYAIVYGIGWFFVFWGYGYPLLETLLDKETGEEYGPGVLKERLNSEMITTEKGAQGNHEDENEEEKEALSFTERMSKKSRVF